MSIKLKGSSDGSVSFDAPADTSPSGSDITLTLPTSAGSANQFLKNSGIAGELEYSSMVEDSSGNVGVNKSSPTSVLHIKSDTNNDVNNGILFEAADSTHKVFRLLENSTGEAYSGWYYQNSLKNVIRTNGDSYFNGGDVGIGTSTPRSKTEVYDSAVSGAFSATDLSTWRVLQVRNNIEQNTGTAAGIALGGDGTSDTETAGIVGISDNSTGGVCQLAFLYASGNVSKEGMRIDSSGRVNLGDSPSTNANGNLSSSGNKLYITFGHNFGQNAIATNVGAYTGTYSHHVFYNGNGLVGTINTSGSSTSFNTSSDYRLKENVVDLDGAITRVKQLQPRRFNFIADAETTVDGFIAHEAQTVVPEAVTGTHNEVDEDDNPVYQGIDQSKLVPLLTAALQEAIAKIETLETKVAALEAA